MTELCHDSVKDIKRDQSLLPSAKLNSFTQSIQIDFCKQAHTHLYLHIHVL
jgi:hypothetical protein